MATPPGGRLVGAVLASVLTLVTGCAGAEDAGETDGAETPPQRFTIAPDDYHVPYAGTAQDGRRFFLSDELFDAEGNGGELTSYVGLFLWNPDGTFDEVRVDAVDRPEGLPPGQAGSSDADDLVAARLRELGTYELGAITVEPFTTSVDGVEFGWEVSRYDDGTYAVGVRPGDFIVYYAPWDGEEYDT